MKQTQEAIIDEIMAGWHDENLDNIRAAIRCRRDNIAAEFKMTLRVGDTVQFNDEVRPKYLAGALAEVVKVLPKNIDVQMLEQRGRFGGKVRTSVALIDLVESGGIDG